MGRQKLKIKKCDISDNPQHIFWVLIEARKTLNKLGCDDLVKRIDRSCGYQCKDYDKYISL